MKAALALVMLASTGLPCNATEFARQAISGQPKTVYVYRNWNKECEEQGGVVRVVTKPKHGRLSRQRVIEPMLSQGRSPDSHCLGKSIPGLQVQHTSDRGFRGIDQFILERTLHVGTVVDTFTMDVR
jgi:hypothetical protein